MERYQVLLEPEQKARLQRVAEKQRRSAASVLRQALDIGLDMLESKSDVWEQRMKILEKARLRLQRLPLIELDIVNADRQEREGQMEQRWRL
jgi:predicted transcriptional regulator